QVGELVTDAGINLAVPAWLHRVGIDVTLVLAQILHDLAAQVVDDLCDGGCAEADGVSEAVTQCNAMVGDVGWQIENVAGFDDPFLPGLEVLQQPQAGVGDQRAVAVRMPTHAPALAAHALDQEYIIVVEMGADAASIAGKTDHDIVD